MAGKAAGTLLLLSTETQTLPNVLEIFNCPRFGELFTTHCKNFLILCIPVEFREAFITGSGTTPGSTYFPIVYNLENIGERLSKSAPSRTLRWFKSKSQSLYHRVVVVHTHYDPVQLYVVRATRHIIPSANEEVVLGSQRVTKTTTVRFYSD